LYNLHTKVDFFVASWTLGHIESLCRSVITETNSV